ncbi:MAG: hypothetical protein M3R04_01385 [bacterium]|nr:hypothetical protein [bacterium]
MTPTSAELEDVLAKATPGPWRVRPPNSVAILGMRRHVRADGSHIDFESMLARVEQNPNREANANLIALAPALAAEVVRLREALAEQQAVRIVTKVREPFKVRGA